MSLLPTLTDIDENPTTGWQLGQNRKSSHGSPEDSIKDNELNEIDKNSQLGLNQNSGNRILSFFPRISSYLPRISLTYRRPTARDNVKGPPSSKSPAPPVWKGSWKPKLDGESDIACPAPVRVSSLPSNEREQTCYAGESEGNCTISSEWHGLKNGCEGCENKASAHPKKATGKLLIDVMEARSERCNAENVSVVTKHNVQTLSPQESRAQKTKRLLSLTRGKDVAVSSSSPSKLNPDVVRGRLLRQQSDYRSKFFATSTQTSTPTRPRELAANGTISLHSNTIEQQALPISRNVDQTGHLTFQGKKQIFSQNDLKDHSTDFDLRATAEEDAGAHAVTSCKPISRYSWEEVESNSSSEYSHLFPKIPLPSCGSLKPNAEDKQIKGQPHERETIQNSCQRLSSSNSSAQYVSMSCPACKTLLSVLYQHGTVHVCSNCHNSYCLVEKTNNVTHGEKTAEKNIGSVGRKRPSTPKTKQVPRKTPKKPECVTIISSDEDDTNENNKGRSSVAVSDRLVVKSNDGIENKTAACPSASPKLSERMKLKGGQNPRAGTGSEIDQSLMLNIDFIQFGTVPGKALEPLRLSSKSMYMKVGLIHETEKQKRNSKETVASGSFSATIKEEYISSIKLHVGHSPSLLIIYPTSEFCSYVNNLFGKAVLGLEENDFLKSQIVITFAKDPTSESEGNEVIQQIKTVTAVGDKLQLISQKEAEHMLSKIRGFETSDKIFNLRLSAEQPRTSDTCESSSIKTETLLVYPRPAAHGSVTITLEDIDCLAEGVYLNDVILDFYLRFLLESKLNQEDAKRTHLFSSFFYKRLTHKALRHDMSEEAVKLSLPQRMHQQVKKWTRNVNIFEKDFILIPVNEHSHWYLVIICFPSLVPSEAKKSAVKISCQGAQVNGDVSAMEVDTPKLCDPAYGEESDDSMSVSPATSSSPFYICSSSNSQTDATPTKASSFTTAGPSVSSSYTNHVRNAFPCILIFDSLGLRTSNRVFSNIRHYLTQEWKVKKPGEKSKVFDKDTMKGSFPKVPLQSNDCDCGIYVLQYAEMFFLDPITNFKPPIKKEQWFSSDAIKRKRSEIRNLIMKLTEESKSQ